MRRILLLLGLLPLLAYSQPKTFATKAEANKSLIKGTYITSIGWQIIGGQEIKFGTGTMPDKSFAFIYELPNALLYNSSIDYSKRKLRSIYNGRTGKLVDMGLAGNKKVGFYIMARVAVGEMTRYILDIENAIYAGEIVPPAEFASKVKLVNNDAAQISIADELKKLKELLDSGAITQQEYDLQKKKLLNQ